MADGSTGLRPPSQALMGASVENRDHLRGRAGKTSGDGTKIVKAAVAMNGRQWSAMKQSYKKHRSCRLIGKGD